MSTETSIQTRTYYEGPDPSELGSYGEPVKQAAEYVRSLNGTTRLRLAVDQVKKPWEYGEYTDAFFEDDRGVFSHLRREGVSVFETAIFGPGATQEFRREVFGKLGFNERLKRDTLEHRYANFITYRTVYLG